MCEEVLFVKLTILAFGWRDEEKLWKTLSQDSWWSRQELKQAPCDYKSKAFLLEPTSAVTLIQNYAPYKSIFWGEKKTTSEQIYSLV
jgi:hypothetical protein